MFFNKKSLFVLLCAFFCAQMQGMEQRDLIMIIDDPMLPGQKPPVREAIDTTVLQVTENLITKAAPMIVSSHTWHNFVTSRHNFNQKKNDPKNIENKVYTQIYRPMSEAINNAAKQSGYNAETIASIVGQKAQTCENTISTLANQIGQAFSTPEWSVLDKEFTCFAIPFNPSEWDIYTYKDVLYVLIPHDYANRINKEYPKKSLENLTFKDHKTGKTMEKNIALLGIKTTNLTKLTVSDPYKLPYKEPKTQLAMESGIPMDEILVTNKDVITSKKTSIVHPFLWNVFIMGHGSYYIAPDFQADLDAIPHDIQKNKQAIEQLTGISFKYADYESVIMQLKSRIQQSTPANKEKFEQALTHAEKIKDDYMWADNKIFNNPNIMIAGMPALAFTKLLQFFNNEVDTAFLFYETCFSGARNLLYPYLSAFGQPIKYNYTIATGTVNDEVTMSSSDDILMSNCAAILPRNIYAEKNKATLIQRRGKEDFKQFFEALHTNKPLAQTLKYVHGEIFFGTEGAKYKPVVRLPGSTVFNINDIDAKIQRISRVILSIANMQGKLTIDGTKKPGVVLNTYFIPVPITFVNELPASITSSIYEPTIQELEFFGGAITAFYFKQITMPSMYASVSNLAYLLLQGAMHKESQGRNPIDNPIPKVFVIDTFIDPEETPYEKLIIFNNAMLPLALIKGEVSDDADTFSTGYMYTHNGTITMNVWETTINWETGTRTTNHIDRTLTEQKEIEKYHELFDSAKNALTEKANSEGLSIIPLETVTKAIQSQAAKQAK